MRVEAYDYELDGDLLTDEVRAADAVVDCTDNFPSRFALNRVCVASGTPLVSGAAIRFQGQLAWTHRSVFGGGQQFTVSASGSAIENEAALSLRQPYVGAVGPLVEGQRPLLDAPNEGLVIGGVVTVADRRHLRHE